MSAGDLFDVVWPLSAVAKVNQFSRTGLEGLDGKRVAFIWDEVFRGDVIFEVLSEKLVADYPTVEIVGYREFGNFHGRQERQVVDELPNRLRDWRIDAAIVGVGA